eukprot:TRINITY_DN5360_c0_g1_i4.p1 TRINITY_DN5360_c0_g1~~TRINITY_DN5360_c0_g1_i4.p1  ORF type:complete len:246 (-),score=25.80 TRINITY_DN5360_c0_g1_i4:533-1270(-)
MMMMRMLPRKHPHQHQCLWTLTNRFASIGALGKATWSQVSFNIAINYLNSLIVASPLSPSLHLSSLFYCDDTVLISTTEEEIQLLLKILVEFTNVSGLSINPSKCVIFNNISDNKLGFESPSKVMYLSFTFNACGLISLFEVWFDKLPLKYSDLQHLNLLPKGCVQFYISYVSLKLEFWSLAFPFHLKKWTSPQRYIFLPVLFQTAPSVFCQDDLTRSLLLDVVTFYCLTLQGLVLVCPLVLIQG